MGAWRRYGVNAVLEGRKDRLVAAGEGDLSRLAEDVNLAGVPADCLHQRQRVGSGDVAMLAHPCVEQCEGDGGD